jgi:hypothetical protein
MDSVLEAKKALLGAPGLAYMSLKLTKTVSYDGATRRFPPK